MRWIWCSNRGEWVSPAEFYSARRNETVSGLARPFIRADGMRDTLNHVDGRTYDSKSAYEAAVKEAGIRDGKTYEIVGNDPSLSKPKEQVYDPKGLREDICKAIQEHS